MLTIGKLFLFFNTLLKESGHDVGSAFEILLKQSLHVAYISLLGLDGETDITRDF